VSRFAIGYSPEEIHRPVAIFVETGDGVLVQSRGEASAQLLDRPFGPVAANAARHSEVRPGDVRYFEVVLESFSTRFLFGQSRI
jgi:hypothetical protein